MTNPDEQEIRQLVNTWMQATRAGDIETVLSLMADDVIFLLPGRQPMRKADFSAATKTAMAAVKIEGHSDIQEIKVAGEYAFMWNKLTVIMNPPDAKPVKRAGDTLTIFRKEKGKWLLLRDANMLVVVPGSPD